MTLNYCRLWAVPPLRNPTTGPQAFTVRPVSRAQKLSLTHASCPYHNILRAHFSASLSVLVLLWISWPSRPLSDNLTLPPFLLLIPLLTPCPRPPPLRRATTLVRKKHTYAVSTSTSCLCICTFRRAGTSASRVLARRATFIVPSGSLPRVLWEHYCHLLPPTLSPPPAIAIAPVCSTQHTLTTFRKLLDRLQRITRHYPPYTRSS